MGLFQGGIIRRSGFGRITVQLPGGRFTLPVLFIIHLQMGIRDRVTDALGNTVCAGYDARGRKTAEWGTGTQPLLMEMCIRDSR